MGMDYGVVDGYRTVWCVKILFFVLYNFQSCTLKDFAKNIATYSNTLIIPKTWGIPITK